MPKKPHSLPLDPSSGVKKRTSASKDRGSATSTTPRKPATSGQAGPYHLRRSRSRTSKLNLAGEEHHASLLSPGVGPMPTAATPNGVTPKSTGSNPRSTSTSRTPHGNFAMDEEETVTSSSGASPDSSLTSKIRNRQRRPCLVESEQEAVTSSRERSLTVELDNLRNNLRQAEGVLSAMKGKDDPGSDVDSKYDGIGKPAQRSVRQQQHLVAALKAQIYDTEQMVVRQKKIKIHQREIADIYRQCTTTEEKIMQLEQRLHFLQREAGDDSSQACELFRDAIQEQDTLQGSIKMGIGETDARKKAKFIPSASNEIGSLEAQLRGLDIWYSDKRESFS